MIHAYDPSTGELMGICQGPSPEQAVAWTAQGLTVVEGPVIDRELYYYEGDQLAARLLVTLSADKDVIAADGLDAAAVSVQVAPTGHTEPEPPEAPQPIYPASVDIDVNGQSRAVSLSDGQGSLGVTADQAGAVAVSAADQLRAHDYGGLVITAQ